MIEIIAYRMGWPLEFRQIAFSLRQGLGPLALRIDHIGSTAVPGLAAKDVIDVQISVAAFNPVLLSALERLGYSRLEDFRSDHRPARAGGADLEWQKWFFYPPSGHRRTNTHLRMQGRANQRYALLFRDYLRAHPATAESYEPLDQAMVVCKHGKHQADARAFAAYVASPAGRAIMRRYGFLLPAETLSPAP